MRPRPGSTVLLEAPRRDGLPALRRGRLLAIADDMVGVELRPGSLAELVAPVGGTVSLRSAGVSPGVTGRVLASVAGRDSILLAVDTSTTDLERRRHGRTLVDQASLDVSGDQLPVVDVGAGGLRVAAPLDRAVRYARLDLGGETLELEVVPLHPFRLRFPRPVPDLEPERVVASLTLSS